MNIFDYEALPDNLMTPDIVQLLTTIHEFKGKQELYLEANPNILSTLSEVAKIQSTDASNRIEGIFTSDKRLLELVEEKTMPKNRNEEEIAGYRDALSMIHESYDYIEPTPSVILQLHRELYRHTSSSFGGSWKHGDNIITEMKNDGKQVVRFQPTSAVSTPAAMDELCATYIKAIERSSYDSLLLTCMFILDITCIHPFNDGNGRISRLLTLLLLYRNNYLVGKYISIERMIEESKETYYQALRASSLGWHENANDYQPFVRYLLGIIIASYREFTDRVSGLVIGKKSKPERIEDVIYKHMGKITKSEILMQCPDISETTVERTLSALLKKRKIKKVGGGRSTGYTKV